MLIIPPYPEHPSPDDFDVHRELEKAFKVCPQLFFMCRIRPLNDNGTRSCDVTQDISLQLMYFSVFMPCNLTPTHPLQQAGNEMLYDPSPMPILYVGHVKHALCRVPLIPCFLNCNSTPTIPRSFAGKKASKFPHGQSDTATTNGSRLFEVNNFMWQFGRPKGRQISVTDACIERQKMQEMGRSKRLKTRRINQNNQRFAIVLEADPEVASASASASDGD